MGIGLHIWTYSQFHLVSVNKCRSDYCKWFSVFPCMDSQGFSPSPLSASFPRGHIWTHIHTYTTRHARTVFRGGQLARHWAGQSNPVPVPDNFPGFSRAQTHSWHSLPSRSRSLASLLLTPPAGGQGSRKQNRAWEPSGRGASPVGIPETGVGGDQDRPELPPLAPLPCCLMGYKGEGPQTGRQMGM